MMKACLRQRSIRKKLGSQVHGSLILFVYLPHLSLFAYLGFNWIPCPIQFGPIEKKSKKYSIDPTLRPGWINISSMLWYWLLTAIPMMKDKNINTT